MNNSTRNSAPCPNATEPRGGCRRAEPAYRAPNPAREQRHEGLFVPFAAFASLAGTTGLPFVSL